MYKEENLRAKTKSREQRKMCVIRPENENTDLIRGELAKTRLGAKMGAWAWLWNLKC